MGATISQQQLDRAAGDGHPRKTTLELQSGVGVRVKAAPVAGGVGKGALPPLSASSGDPLGPLHLSLSATSFCHLHASSPLSTLLAAIESLYHVWNWSTTRKAWAGVFLHELQRVELALLQATEEATEVVEAVVQRATEDMQQMTALLTTCTDLLQSILGRPHFLSQVLAAHDAEQLEQMRVRFEQLCEACVRRMSTSSFPSPSTHAHAEGGGILRALEEEKERERAAVDVRIRIPPSPTAVRHPPPTHQHSARLAPLPPASVPPSPLPATAAKPAEKSAVSLQPLTAFKLLNGAQLTVSDWTIVPHFSPLTHSFSDLYALWNAASNRTEPIAEFFAHLHQLECDLLRAGLSSLVSSSSSSSFDLAPLLRSCQLVLEEVRVGVTPIVMRSTFVGLQLLRADRDAVEQLEAQLDELRREVLHPSLPSLSPLPGSSRQARTYFAHRVLKDRERTEEEVLRNMLQPMDFVEEIEEERSKYCVGTRTGAVLAVQAWIESLQAPPPSSPESSSASSAPSPPSRVYWLRGGPGIGKTTLSCVFLDCFPTFFIGVHLGRHELQERRAPTAVVKSLAFQLCVRLKGFRKAMLERASSLTQVVPHASAAELWDLLLVQTFHAMEESTSSDVYPSAKGTSTATSPVSAAAQQTAPICILIDALDECADGHSSQGAESVASNALLRLLATQINKLPSWVCVLITSRPDPPIPRVMRRLRALTRDAYEEAENQRDLRLFLRQQCKTALGIEGGADLERATEILATKAQGMFLYARLLIERLAALREQRLQEQEQTGREMLELSSLISIEQDLELLPDGLSNFYAEHMKRVEDRLAMYEFRQENPWFDTLLEKHHCRSGMELLICVLELLVCSFEPLTLSSMVRIMHFPDEAAQERLLQPLGEGGLFQFVAVESRGTAIYAAHTVDPSSSPSPSSSSSSSARSYAPFHKSIFDWLTHPDRSQNPDESRYFVDVLKGHQRMREACWRRLVVQEEEKEREEQKEEGRQAQADSASPLPYPPFLCVDQGCDPAVYVPPSSFLSYAVRFGPKHCLAAAVTQPDEDPSGSSSSSSLPPLSSLLSDPSSPSFLSRYPFLAAAQFLCHLQYLHLRASLNDLSDLTLEYAAAQENGEGWEQELSRPHELERMTTRSTLNAGPAPVAMTPSNIQRLPKLGAPPTPPTALPAPPKKMAAPPMVVPAPATVGTPPMRMPAPAAVRAPMVLPATKSLSVPADSAASASAPTSSASSSSPSWLWLTDPALALQAIRDFRFLVQLEMKQWRGSYGGKHATSSISAEHSSRFGAHQREISRNQFATLPSSSSPSLDCYATSTQLIATLTRPVVASQYLYASALAFPDSSLVVQLGARRFDAWFVGWPKRCVPRVQWDNKPNRLPNLVSTLPHAPRSVGGGGGSTSVSQRRLGGVRIHALSYSPDGQRIASVCSVDRCIRIFHAVSYELLQVIEPSGSGALNSSFTPNYLYWLSDSIHVACGGYRSPLSIYSIRTGERVSASMGSASHGVEACYFLGGGGQFSSHGGPRRGGLHDSDPTFVFIVGYSRLLQLFHVPSGRLLRSFDQDCPHHDRISLLEPNADGTLMASAGRDEFVVVWHLGSKEQQREAARAAETAESTPDSQRVLDAWVHSIQPLIVLVPPLSSGFSSAAQRIVSLALHINDMAWHPTLPQVIVTASSDAYGNGLCLWDLAPETDGEQGAVLEDGVALPPVSMNPLRNILQKAECHIEEEFTHLAFTPTGSHLFVSSLSSTTLALFQSHVTNEGQTTLHQQREALDLEFLGVVEVGEVGTDITCLNVSGGRGGRRRRRGAKRTPSSSGVSAAPTEDDLKHMHLLTGDTDGAARVWNVKSLIQKARPEVPSAGALPPSTDGEADSSSASSESASLFPRISLLTSNERFIVIADAASTLHVYHAHNGQFLRAIPHVYLQETGGHSTPCGLIVSLSLGSSSSRTPSHLCLVSYEHFSGVQVWDVASGCFMRVVGSGVAPKALKTMRWNPFPQLSADPREKEREDDISKACDPTIPQFLSTDLTYLNLWSVPPPPHPVPVRTIFHAAPRPSQKGVSALTTADGRPVETQHGHPIVDVCFHPSLPRIASIDAKGYVKLWAPRTPTPEEIQAHPERRLQWDARACIMWTHMVGMEEEEMESTGEGNANTLTLTCCAFSPGKGELLAVGGLHHCFTLLDSTAPTPTVVWSVPQGDCVALALSPCATYLATVDRSHTISVWDVQQRRLRAQYFNHHSLEEGASLWPANSQVHVAFTDENHLLFQHEQENCVKVWRMDWKEKDEKQQTRSVDSSSSSSPLPLLFYSDRLTSSSQSTLIHFFSHC